MAGTCDLQKRYTGASEITPEVWRGEGYAVDHEAKIRLGSFFMIQLIKGKVCGKRARD